MKLRNAFFIFLAIIVLASCKNDDDGTVTVVDPVLLSETEEADDAEILAFVQSHFYNYEEFASPEADFDYKVRFDTIAGDNSDKVSIFDSGQFDGVEFITKTISVASSSFGLTDEEVIDHKLYVLVVRQGNEEGTPTIGDNAVLRYEGSLLDGTLFDASSSQPVVFNLSGVVPGFGNGVTFFQTGMGPLENGDGTISYEDYGVGALFIPSGLAYFSQSAANGIISSYTPIVFKIDAFAYEENTDSDGDGIPSILEDIDRDGNLNNDNTDNTVDTTPNYLDTDDDGDGILTLDEISDDDGNIITPYPDSDGDGTPDYLDSDF